MLSSASHRSDETGLISAGEICATKLTCAQSARIFILEPSYLWYVTTEGRRLQVSLEEVGLSVYVAEIRQIVCLDRDAHLHPQFNSRLDWRGTGSPQALVCGPVRGVEGGVQGVFVAGKHEPGPFSIEDRVALEMTAKMTITTLRQVGE